MNMDKENIRNLTGLWKKYGAHNHAKVEHFDILNNHSWPYRVWFESSDSKEFTSAQKIREQNNLNWLEQLPDNGILPVWNFGPGKQDDKKSELEKRLVKSSWVCTFEQLAMYKTLCAPGETFDSANKTENRPGITLSSVKNFKDICEWTEVASDAFDYVVEREVIEGIVDDSNIHILLARLNREAVATALLYKTGDIIGIHQVGVKHAKQGQGIARVLMETLINKCISMGAKHLVLQASVEGRHLYESLGFNAQFSIRNYQKAS